MDVNKTIQRFIKVAFKILIALLIVYATVGISKVAYDFGYRVFTEPAMAEAPGEDVLIQIKEGMSAQELGQMLEEKGLVRDGNLFYLQLKLSAYSKKMELGVYTLNTSMTAKDMMVTISDTADQRASEEAAAATQEAEGAAGAEITQEADVPASEGE
ncbi:MAG: endolytic transglycosylase MltG [Agathobacter sp.]|nr:endolytic transglycosylase MltG [Agathobacter sp.]